MDECITYVGLDVHQASIVAALLNTRTGEVKRATFARPDSTLRKLCRWIERESDGPAYSCYEAGGAGYEVQRAMQAAGLSCVVVAPSLVYHQSGNKRKTDQRDALMLAQQLAHGMLVEVHPPSEEQEAARALLRARDDAREVLHQARQRVLKYLGQRGLTYQGTNWCRVHRRWLAQLQLPVAMAQTVLEELLLAVDQGEQRLARLDELVEELAKSERYNEPVGLLRCLRGVDTLTAMVLLTELYQFGRFASPRAVMGYLGLIPGEQSSGEKQRSTGLTKTGNRFVRRLLTEAAWHYSKAPARLSQDLRKRQAGQPAGAIALAQRAMTRLRKRYWHLVERGKLPKVAIMAVARELAGVIWVLLQPWAAAQRVVA